MMDELYKHIAATLKRLRNERGWSLDKTAQETGVSKAMLGQIERQESSPTIATLWKIASGFQTSFSTFIEVMPINANQAIYRPGYIQALHPDDQLQVVPLFPFDPELNCEVFIIHLAPGSEHLSPPHKPGVIEHVIVIEGCIEVLLEGKWQPIKSGAGLRFQANQPHGYRNLTKTMASFHNIIHYPQQTVSWPK